MSEAERIRIGNQQREEAITSLNDHFAAGRLDIGEYEVRVGQAAEAQYAEQLAGLFTDLPHPRPDFLPPPTYAGPPPMDVPPPPPPFAQPQTGTYYPPPPAGFPPTGPYYAAPSPYGPHGHPAPYGYDQFTGQPLSNRSKVVAGLLQIFLSFGIGRFYTGHYGIAIAQLLTCGGLGVWTLVDGIILLVSGGTDPYGRKLRD
ncbi:DUF1707 domain-containing protein [Saccharothrix violaceirubra]|uniref:TM2 domain-containing membrane protein YozV n=1 Tax=Saccharothrix violaceirubra TaxID=413306 RepID=A0A7W7T0R4_9PSEU|nr:DUF1707 domain-containing protein [Saccharothrix violaceirubra]MBB4964405.1 TM2 domain-containing membrane protein YozV [Saccharothrix violaceirubra]